MTRSCASLSGYRGAADLGNPQRDAVVDEQREGQAELVAVERPVRFADHHRLEAPIWIAQCREQRAGLRSARPRQGPALAHVEELGHDHAAVWLDERLAPVELPGS